MTGTFLIGLAIAATLGTIVTDIRTADLNRDLSNAFSRQRWRTFLEGRNQVSRQWLLWACSRLLRIEWVIILLVLWVLALLFCVLMHRHWTGEQPAWAFAGGSVVGFLAAPWVWLHFSRDLRSNQGEAEAFMRYRFLSILLGILLGVYFAAPAIMQLLPRAEKVEAWGFAITVAGGGGDVRATNIIANTSSPQRVNARQRLTSGTQAASRIVNATNSANLQNVNILKRGAGAREFDELSAIDRDRAFISYLIYHSNQESLRKYEEQLENYVSIAETLEAQDSNVKNDTDFLLRVSPLLSCADYYAKTINDAHLYFLKVSDVLEWLALRLKWSLGQKAPDPDLDRFDERVRKQASELRTRMVASIEATQSDLQSKVRTLCPDFSEPVLPRPFPTGATPYPALVAAYSFAAVGSAEAGALTLSDWLQSKPTGQAATVRDRYYIVRTRINLLQLAATELSDRIVRDGVVLLQRDTTDHLAALLQVTSADRWKALCRDLARPGLHNHIGRMVAFLYASERSYLFELQDMDTMQLWRNGKRTELTRNLNRDLAEAQAFTETPDCFLGVQRYEGSPTDTIKLSRQWVGQFRLNLIQLRLVRAVTLPDDERRKSASSLSYDLELAEADLGPTPNSSLATASPADMLLSFDTFDDQRVRLLRLRDLALKMTKL